MIALDEKTAQQVLDALEMLTDGYDDNAVGAEIEAITALRQAIEQQEQEQETVAQANKPFTHKKHPNEDVVPLFTEGEIAGKDSSIAKALIFNLARRLRMNRRSLHRLENHPGTPAEILEYHRGEVTEAWNSYQAAKALYWESLENEKHATRY